MQIGEIIQCRIVCCPQRGQAQASFWLNLIVPSARWGCGRSKQCQSSFPTIWTRSCTSVTNAARGQRGRSSGFKSRRRLTPPLLIECIRGRGGLSGILRGSSDAAVCADLAPLADGHLDGRDLLRRRIIDDGARKDLTTPSQRTGCRSRRARNKTRLHSLSKR
jgi:hypothetical protein